MDSLLISRLQWESRT